MKVLTNPETGSPLVFPVDGDEFVGLDRKASATGLVSEVPDKTVNRAVAAAMRRPAPEDATGEVVGVPIDPDDPFAFHESGDLKRDLRWIAKAVADVADGSRVGLKRTARGYSLDVPEGARPNRSEGIGVGTRVAVGPNISPKTAMNAHGVVDSISGKRATVTLDEGDHDRLVRATGKKYGRTMPFPLSSLERE
jgi:hypothetical protein